MNIKVILTSLLLSATLSFSSLASNHEENSGSAQKRSAQTAFGDTIPNNEAKKPRYEESTIQAPAKPSILDFPIIASDEYHSGGKILFTIKHKIGDFADLPQELRLKIFTLVSPRTTMLIGKTFYTWATGYNAQKIGLIGLGPDKEPDYTDTLFSLSGEGYRETSETNKKNFPGNEYGSLISETYTPSTIPSAFWYVYLKSTYTVTKDYIPYSINTNIDDLEIHGNEAPEFINFLPMRLETIDFYCTELDDNQLLQLTEVIKSRKSLKMIIPPNMTDNSEESQDNFFANFKNTNVETIELLDLLETNKLKKIFALLTGSKVKHLVFHDEIENKSPDFTEWFAKQIIDLGLEKISVYNMETDICSINFIDCLARHSSTLAEKHLKEITFILTAESETNYFPIDTPPRDLLIAFYKAGIAAVFSDSNKNYSYSVDYLKEQFQSLEAAGLI